MTTSELPPEETYKSATYTKVMCGSMAAACFACALILYTMEDRTWMKQATMIALLLPVPMLSLRLLVLEDERPPSPRILKLTRMLASIGLIVGLVGLIVFFFGFSFVVGSVFAVSAIGCGYILIET